MRSCLHSLLVGVLAFSLSIDGARACGHLRRWRHCAPACATMPVAPTPCGVPACGCGGLVTVGACGGCEEIACGTPLDCGVETVASAPGTEEPVAARVGSATESVVAPAVPHAAPGAPAPIAAVPDLEPVETVSATETEPEMPAEESTVPDTDGVPAGEPGVGDAPMEEPPAEEPPADETMPEEQPVAEPHPEPAPPPAVEPEPQPAPPPRNVFEEEAGEGGGDEPQSLDEPAIAEEPAAPTGDEPAMEEEPSPPPVDDVIPADAPPADESPVGPPPSEPDAGPAAEPAPESGATAEPLRRWIDHTASHAVAGRLVAVQGERVEIVRADGRTVMVPLARLSAFDREYVADAAARLAPAGPRATDTARAAH